MEKMNKFREEMKKTANEIDRTVIACIAVFVAVILLFGVCIGLSVKNEKNRITQGIVVEKKLYPGEISKVGDSLSATSDRYSITIRGEKGGKEVEYTFYVAKEEYDNCRIGQFYER